MRINTVTIVSGLIASAVLVLFMGIIPGRLGLESINLVQVVGQLFNPTSPTIPGVTTMGILGIVWSAIFGTIYAVLPGQALVRGALYGLIIGLISLTILPTILGQIGSLISGQANLVETGIGLDAQTIIQLTAYLLFGVVLAMTTRNNEIDARI